MKRRTRTSAERSSTTLPRILPTNLLPPIEQFLTVRQVAQLIGVCPATVYRWAAIGILPHVRIVNVIRVHRDEFKRFLAERLRISRN